MFRAIAVTAALAVAASLVERSALADEMRCEGQIVRIEGVNVTVKEMAKEQPMKLQPRTMITSGGKPVMVGDLKVGQKVQCLLEKRGDEVVCRAMELMRDTP